MKRDTVLLVLALAAIFTMPHWVMPLLDGLERMFG
jgi:hypothetical protein